MFLPFYENPNSQQQSSQNNDYNNVHPQQTEKIGIHMEGLVRQKKILDLPDECFDPMFSDY